MKKISIMLLMGFLLATMTIQGSNTYVEDATLFKQSETSEETEVDSKNRAVGTEFSYPNSGGGCHYTT